MSIRKSSVRRDKSRVRRSSQRTIRKIKSESKVKIISTETTDPRTRTFNIKKKLKRGDRVKIFTIWDKKNATYKIFDVEVYSSGKMQTKFNGSDRIFHEVYSTDDLWIFNPEHLSYVIYETKEQLEELKSYVPLVAISSLERSMELDRDWYNTYKNRAKKSVLDNHLERYDSDEKRLVYLKKLTSGIEQ